MKSDYANHYTMGGCIMRPPEFEYLIKRRCNNERDDSTLLRIEFLRIFLQIEAHHFPGWEWLHLFQISDFCLRWRVKFNQLFFKLQCKALMFFLDGVKPLLHSKEKQQDPSRRMSRFHWLCPTWTPRWPYLIKRPYWPWARCLRTPWVMAECQIPGLQRYDPSKFKRIPSS